MKSIIIKIKSHLTWNWVKDRCISALLALILFLIFWFFAEVALSNRGAPAALPLHVRIPIEINVASVEPTYAEELNVFSRQLSNAYGISEIKAGKFANWIMLGSTYSNAPEILLASLIMTESTFRENVVSYVGAVGPGQIRLKFWGKLCPNAHDDTQANVTCAGLILRHYYDDFCNQDWSCALQVYNVGPSNYRYSSSYKIASKRYLKKVTLYASQLDKHGSNKIPFPL